MKSKGYKTSEFWLTLATIVGVTVLMLNGNIDQQTWTTVVQFVLPGYAISRGVSKINGE